MKRFGIILSGLMLIITAYAQTDVDTAAVAATDSTLANYQKSPKQAREEALLEKLNPEQLFQLEQKRLDQKKYEEEMPLPAWAITLIATSPFLMVILIVFFSVRSKKEREKKRYDLYMKSLELGQPLPEKFFDEPEKKSSNLKRGAIWLAVGLGVVIFGLFEDESSLMGMGAIPAFVGAAYLLVYFIEKRNNNDTPAVNE